MKWTACGSGVYSSKSALKKLYQADSKVKWHSLVWEKGFVPEYAFILWLMLQQTLITKDRLIKWGVTNILPRCVLRDQGVESVRHLLFQVFLLQVHVG